MARDRFPPEVEAELKWYVYRLVDPRNGETFYVGKGKGNRVFAHALGKLEYKDEIASDAADPKFQRIHGIKATGLEVSHVIHRHGLASETLAYEIEAALIDAYPGLTNRKSGHESRDRGCRHVDEICAEYEAEPFVVTEPLVLISIGNLWRVLGIYEAVQCAWRIRKDKAKQCRLVLAHVRGVVKGAYRPTEWLDATTTNFHQMERDMPGRLGFKGEEAEELVWNSFVGKRVPEVYRKKGAQNPVRHCFPGVSV